MRNKIIIVLLLSFLPKGYSQNITAEKVLMQAFGVYESPRYKMNITYNIYSNNKSTKPKEVANALYYKNVGDFYMKMDNTEKIFIKNVLIHISHSEKAMMISGDDDPSLMPIAMFRQSLKQYAKKDIKDYNTFWRCTLYPAPGSEASVYQYVTIDINKKDYKILKQKYFFNLSLERVYGRKNSEEKEVMEVIVKEFDKNAVIPEGIFNPGSYYSYNGKKYVAKGKQKGYNIISDSK